MVDNYFKVAVWKDQPGSERRRIVQRVFPFDTSSSLATKRALERCMRFWTSLPASDMHCAQLSVYEKCTCGVGECDKTFRQIGTN